MPPRTPKHKPATPAERDARACAELRRVAKRAPAKVRAWLLAMANTGECAEGGNMPEPEATHEKRVEEKTVPAR